ncbi:hypothetical protein D3C87_1877150 [compost metagenome]
MSAITDQDVAVRLEVLKLVNRFDHSPDEITERAAALEKYVLKGAPIAGRPADTRKPG